MNNQHRQVEKLILRQMEQPITITTEPARTRQERRRREKERRSKDADSRVSVALPSVS
jgi:hypothetical protein